MKVQLKEICKIHGGIPAPKAEEAYSKKGIPFVRMKDLGQYHLTSNLIETSNNLNIDYVKDRKLKIIPKGSIILPRSGSVSLNHRAVLGEDAVIVSHICALEVTSEQVNNLYLYYYLIVRNIDNIIKKTTGLDAVTFEDLGNLYVNIPTMKVQKYFVQSLQAIERIIQKRQQTIDILYQLIKSVFFDLFGDPYLNEKNWEKVKVDDIVENIKAGISVSGIHRKLMDDEIAVLKVSAVTKGFFNPKEYKVVDKNIIKKAIVTIKKGDLLFSRANTIDLVAATCIVEEDYPNLFLPDKIWKIELKDNLVKPSYFKMILSNSGYRKSLALKATGSSGSMVNISQEKLKNNSFPLASIKLQSLFEEFVQVTNRISALLNTSLVDNQSLFQSLLQRAFKGEIEFEKEKILEDILPTLKIEELLSDIRLLNTFLEKLQKQDFKTGSNYKMAQNLLFQLIEDKTSGVNQVLAGIEEIILKYEAN